MSKPFASFLLATLAACGCLEEVSLKPELSSVDVQRARVGGASLEVSWKFKECCPSSDQEDIALALQQRIAELFENLVAGRISLARYNDLVRAANNAIKNVVLVCSAADDAPEIGEREVQEAWETCANVARAVRSATR